MWWSNKLKIRHWPLQSRLILYDGTVLSIHFVWSGIKGSQHNHTARKVETNPMTEWQRVPSHFSNRKAESALKRRKTTSSKPTFITCTVLIIRTLSHKGQRAAFNLHAHERAPRMKMRRASLKSTASGAKMDFNGFRYKNMTHKGSVSVLGVQYRGVIDEPGIYWALWRCQLWARFSRRIYN